MGIEDRAPEIQEHYQWFQESFPEVADSIIIYSLGQGETPERVADVELDRALAIKFGAWDGFMAPEEDRVYQKGLLLAGIRDKATEEPLSGEVVNFPNGRSLGQVCVPTEQSMKAALVLFPQMQELFYDATPEMKKIYMAYVGDQEKIHTVDALLFDSTYEKDALGKMSPLATMKGEAVGEAYSTLSLLQRQQRGEFTEQVEPFLEKMRRVQRNHFPNSPNASHALVDEASDAAEAWGKANGEALQEMSPRDMLMEARRVAEALAYPSPDSIAAFEARHKGAASLKGADAWEREQWLQADDAKISVPFATGDMSQPQKPQPSLAPKPQ